MGLVMSKLITAGSNAIHVTVMENLMPKYDYQCASDETHIIEAMRTIAERDDEYTCPCGSYMFRIPIKTFGIQLKGTGWGKDK